MVGYGEDGNELLGSMEPNTESSYSSESKTFKIDCTNNEQIGKAVLS